MAGRPFERVEIGEPSTFYQALDIFAEELMIPPRVNWVITDFPSLEQVRGEQREVLESAPCIGLN